MKRRTSALLAFAALGLLPSVADASTFDMVKTACPVGGKKFEHLAYMSYSTFGSLPDGQPVGSAQFPIELAQCPDNGLVLFRDFDKAMIVKLTPLVLGAEYQKLRATETRYYLAQWLHTRLGDGEDAAVWMLLSATWEAKNAGDSERAARYNSEFVDRALALPSNAASIDSIVLRLRAVNALRELGRFEEAEGYRKALTIAPDAGRGEEAAEQRRLLADLQSRLGRPIARRDSGRTPIDMLSDRDALGRCLEPESNMEEASPLSGFEKDYCSSPEMTKKASLLRQAREGKISVEEAMKSFR